MARISDASAAIDARHAWSYWRAFVRSRLPATGRTVESSLARAKFVAGICALAALLMSQSSYASHHFPEYPVRPAGEYAHKVSKAGLIVAVEPVEDPEQQKKYFNSRLSSKGILPVFIVIQNTSPSQAYLFDRSAVALADIAAISGKRERKTASLLNSGGLIDLTLTTDATQVRENLMKKEVRSTTLLPGSSLRGFIYVPVPTDTPRKKMHLQVPLTNLQSSEAEVLNLFF